MKSFLTLKAGNLNWGHTTGSLSCTSESDAFVTTRFIYKHKLPRTDMRCVMPVQVAEVCIPSLCYAANCFFTPADGFQRSGYAVGCYLHLELVPNEENYLL